MYKAVIFDFDGTICDTGEGVKKCAAYALDSMGIAHPQWNEMDFFIGPPLLVTFQERFNQSPSVAEELVQKFRERYSTKGLTESCLYDGVCDLLYRLKADGIKIGIASSKPQKYIINLLEKYGVEKCFDSVCGVSFNADCESKQSIISRCLGELGVEKADAVMVGDRHYDVDGAKANGIASVGVLWGYGSRFEFIESGADFMAEKVDDIESIALGLYETTENVKGIFNGKIITVHHDDVVLCNGQMAKRECVDHPGGVAVIGITNDNKVLLVRQFRYLYKETIYEIPAGKLEKGEDPFEAGKREFREETGAVAEEYISLGEIYPTPGYTNEIIRLYAAKNIHFEQQELDDGEFLQVCTMTLDELIEKVMAGEIKDAKTIIAALKLKEITNKNDLS